MSATCFVLEESERPIGAFNPQVVPIIPLFAAGEEVAFFPKPRQRGPQRSRQAPEGPAQAASANADDVAEPIGAIADEEEGLCEADEADELAFWVDALAPELLQPPEPPMEEFEQPAPAPVAEAAAEAPPEPAAAGQIVEAPPPPQPAGAAAGPRRAAETFVAMRWGKIASYTSKGSFELVCRNPAHGKCVLARSAKARGAVPGRIPRGGRPLGLLAAWLENGHVASKEEHWSPELLHATKAAREAGRASIKNATNGPALLSYERPKAADLGEASEPDQ